jgi:hypothetical protein
MQAQEALASEFRAFPGPSTLAGLLHFFFWLPIG